MFVFLKFTFVVLSIGNVHFFKKFLLFGPIGKNASYEDEERSNKGKNHSLPCISIGTYEHIYASSRVENNKRKKKGDYPRKNNNRVVGKNNSCT